MPKISFASPISAFCQATLFFPWGTGDWTFGPASEGPGPRRLNVAHSLHLLHSVSTRFALQVVSRRAPLQKCTIEVWSARTLWALWRWQSFASVTAGAQRIKIADMDSGSWQVWPNTLCVAGHLGWWFGCCGSTTHCAPAVFKEGRKMGEGTVCPGCVELTRVSQCLYSDKWLSSESNWEELG